jgi:hypothetical protein
MLEFLPVEMNWYVYSSQTELLKKIFFLSKFSRSSCLRLLYFYTNIMNSAEGYSLFFLVKEALKNNQILFTFACSLSMLRKLIKV